MKGEKLELVFVDVAVVYHVAILVVDRELLSYQFCVF